MILIGSRAAAFRFPPNFLGRSPKDFDFVAYEDEIWDWCKKHNITDAQKNESGKKIISEANLCEFEIILPESSNQYLYDLVTTDQETIQTDFGLIPNRDLLFTLKKSHRYLKNSPHFWKTVMDYHKMKNFGCKVRPEYEVFFKEREKETYTYAHPKLNVMKKDFFKDDNISYVYLHDDIHRAVKYGTVPAYELYKRDGEEVACDKNKFFTLPFEIQIQGVLEECYVLSLERSQIPYPGILSPKQSFMMALSKVCSSITSGWFREFAYENIFEIIKKYDGNYINKFNEALINGKIRKFDSI